ncbi:hypothetical protein RCL1_006902 [Eukaryota sp. TZLM3-RCL]
MNRQQIHLAIVTDENVNKEVSDITINNLPPWATGMKEGLSKKGCFYSAPAVVYVHADKSCPGTEALDAGLVIQNMLLKATELGIGACVVAICALHEAVDQVKEKVGIPVANDFITAVILGIPMAEGKVTPVKEGRLTFIE